ncbi:MAG: hypothetical protein ACYSSL_08100 [Planctomycetota bacterium]|jgi:hypothetical protein
MAKLTGKKTQGKITTKRTKKTSKGQRGLAENIDCLLELHKLQGVLLAQLRKEI